MWQDLRLAWRLVWSNPGFSLTIVLTLAATIGAAAVVFSLFDGVLLRPFPFRDAHELVRIRTFEQGVQGDRRGASIYDFADWQRQQTSFQSLAAYVTYTNNLTGMGPARPVRMTFATASLFPTLGVAPALGRSFREEDDRLGGDLRQAVLSHALWTDLFLGDPSVVGRSLFLRGQSYTIVGVMPPGFAYPDRTQVWVPLMARYASSTNDYWTRRDARMHNVLGRLKSDVAIERAQSQIDGIVRRLAQEFPAFNRQTRAEVVTLREAESGEVRPYVLAVSAAVLLLLLIGCVNVANLMVARASARAREFTIRAALGSSLGRMAQQLFAESLLYAVLGGVSGVLLAVWGVRAVDSLLPPDAPAWMALTIDHRVLIFAAVISFATVLVFGAAPLLHYTRVDLNDVLKQGTKGSSGGGSLARQLRRALVITEVALSLVLLVAAGLMLRSLEKLLQVDTGIETGGLVVATVGQYRPNLSFAQSSVLYANDYRRLAEALRELPGVSLVSGGNDLHYLNQPEARAVRDLYTRRRSLRDEAYRGPTQGADVMPGYFDALGIPIKEGRDFTEADDNTRPGVVVLNQYAAETLFPGESAVGQQIRYGNDATLDPWMTVIGVVGNTKWNPAERSPGFEIYWSYRQYSAPNIHLLIRSSLDPARLIAQVRSRIHQFNPDMAIERIEPMTRIAESTLWQRRLWGLLLAVFAALALLLAAVGLYGVMSYLVALQKREIGIRLAVGATAQNVMALVVGRGISMVAIGAALGLGASVVVGQLLSSLLFELSPLDGLTYGVVLLTQLAVALVACSLPAWRAAQVDPLIALRNE